MKSGCENLLIRFEEQQVWDALLRLLEGGGVVGYPTETVWGLAALPGFASQLTLRKGREEGKPLQVSCTDKPVALSLAERDPRLEALSRFWPGPLTIVTRASLKCPPLLAPGGWVGLRIPNHPVALQLLQSYGPLATTSLNPAGYPAAKTYQEALDYALADELLGSSTDEASGLASTVIRLSMDNPASIELLRQGEISMQELLTVLEPLKVGLKVQEP